MPNAKKSLTQNRRKRRRIPVPPKAHKLRALGPLEMRTKLFGLRVLQRVCKLTKTRFLPYRVYRHVKDFSLRDFENPESGRLIVRTDPRSKNFSQKRSEWNDMPRANFDLSDASFNLSDDLVGNSERRIQYWMNRTSAYRPSCIFIVHKARPIADYRKNVQINVNLVDGMVRLHVNDILRQATTFRKTVLDGEMATFRISKNHSLVPATFRISKNHSLVPFDSPMSSNPPQLLPKPVYARLGKILAPLVEYAKKTGHTSFETSCVTYKDAPNNPEFYDLLLGK